MEFDFVHQSAFGVGKCFVATSNTLQFVLLLVALCHCDSGSMMHILTFGVCVCVVNSVSCSSEKKNKQRAYNDNIENGRQMPVCGIPLIFAKMSVKCDLFRCLYCTYHEHMANNWMYLGWVSLTISIGESAATAWDTSTAKQGTYKQTLLDWAVG